jgi:uncharacterized damage-inducible protein DinB
MNFSETIAKSYSEARTRLTILMATLNESDLKKKITPCPNSIGFLLRHLADVELLFSKNVFKQIELSVKAKTVIAKKDTGEWTNLKELLDYLNLSFNTIVEIINKQSENSWNELITTNEFGTKTKAEAFGRIVSHTAYHTGQIALILKYGKSD